MRRAALSAVTLVWICGLLFAADPPGLWLDVPFVKQEKDACGPASIAMVMQYWQGQAGANTSSPDVVRIQQDLSARAAYGLHASDMENYFHQNGYRTFAFHGAWQDLKQHLEKGRPLIVALKPGKTLPLHYVVVAGLDFEHALVLINDPAQRKLLKEDRARFEQAWSAANNWTLLAVPETGSH